MMKLLPLLLAAVISSPLAAADLKVAVVDMKKAFAEFHKTKDASGKLKSNRDKAMSEVNERYQTYKTLVNEVQKLSKESQDPILTVEGRAKAQNAYNEKVKEARALEQDLNEFQQRRRLQLGQEEMQLQAGLYDEIGAVVKDMSKTAGYDFVFDKSGVSATTVPFLLFYKEATDMTDQVIVELNKNAPADTGKKDEEKKDEKKEEPKKDDSK